MAKESTPPEGSGNPGGGGAAHGVPPADPEGSGRVLLYDLLHPADTEAVRLEVGELARLTAPETDTALLDTAMADVVRLFKGEYPGYRASNTRYHDLEHTCSVYLATARLAYGCVLEGHTLRPRALTLLLLASLFHDTGLIQEEWDTKGTGAKYTVGHELRSIAFIERWLKARAKAGLYATAGLEQDLTDIAAVISCTILAKKPDSAGFSSPEIELAGRILGTTDVLAQMADRAYLEKLLLLYQEFQEAGLPGFSSELELLEKTEDFYKKLITARFDEQFDGVRRHMSAFFKARHGLDEDLYAGSLEANIDYLRQVLEELKRVYRDKLRRAGVLGRLGF